MQYNKIFIQRTLFHPLFNSYKVSIRAGVLLAHKKHMGFMREKMKETICSFIDKPIYISFYPVLNVNQLFDKCPPIVVLLYSMNYLYLRI